MKICLAPDVEWLETYDEAGALLCRVERNRDGVPMLIGKTLVKPPPGGKSIVGYRKKPDRKKPKGKAPNDHG